MEKFNLNEDLTVCCVQATSFPQGIQEAFNTLYGKIKECEGRQFFGISYQPGTHIVYKAAVLQAYEGEAQNHGLEIFVIKKGEYAMETVHDWRKHEATIGKTFQKLLASKQLDPRGACVEWYKNGDVMCMVRLSTEKKLT